MSKIEVDYSYFTKVINSLEAYSDYQKINMNQLKQEVYKLNTSWKGADYNAYKLAFDSLQQEKSAAKALQESVDSYARILKATANEYKTAQQKALDLANKI